MKEQLSELDSDGKFKQPREGYTKDVNRMSLEDVFQDVDKVISTLSNEIEYPYTTELFVSEFSSYCPLTGHPDYATLKIVYELEKGNKLIEQKALRNWLNSFRVADAYQEEISIAIFDLIKRLSNSKRILVVADWKGRGGISNKVTVGDKTLL